jgi:hypothetical protein
MCVSCANRAANPAYPSFYGPSFQPHGWGAQLAWLLPNVASNVDQSPQTVSKGTALGSGLPWGSYSILLLLSIGLFTFWSGALWQTGPHDSHVARFAVSYGSVIPLALGLLLLASRLTWSHLITAVATVWGIKLLVTLPLYLAFASGGAMLGLETRSAAPTAKHTTPADSADYQAAESGFANGSIDGKLIIDAELGAGEALVYVDNPPAGVDAPSGEVLMTIAEGRYDRAIYLISTDDQVSVKNDDSVLHTVRMSGTGVARLNAPVVAGATSGPFELTGTGLFVLRCDNHPTDRNEHANALVVDHPYAVRAKPDGTFKMKTLPTGLLRIAALHAGKHGVAHAQMDVRVEEGVVSRIALRFSEQQGSQPAVEKTTP